MNCLKHQRYPGIFLLIWGLLMASPLTALSQDDQACSQDKVKFQTGYGCWVYHDTGDNKGRPVKVWYYNPAKFSTRGGKVIFAMHSSDRNAKAVRAQWRSYADLHGALILAPEFSREYYPKGRHYNRGNVRNSKGQILPASDWTYNTIEEIFDLVRGVFPAAPNRYSLQGHSAGGQFVHRMVMMSPDYRIESAVAANSGWYILPDENYNYPCGVSNISKSQQNLIKGYARKLVVALGTKDNDRNAKWLSHDSCAEMQGSHRYARGKFFYEYARKDAANRGVPFNWKLVEVQGAVHNSADMLQAGTDEILEPTYKDQAVILSVKQDATVKRSYPAQNYGQRTTLKIDGNSKKITYLQFDLRSYSKIAAAILQVEVTDPSNGVQAIHEANSENWSETTLTFNNQPGLKDLVTTIDGSAVGELNIDLTDFIRSKLGRMVTLVLSSSDANGLYIKSKESGSPPELVLYP
jgi:pimeloyl-ACP methyl ester carboxylesterase